MYAAWSPWLLRGANLPWSSGMYNNILLHGDRIYAAAQNHIHHGRLSGMPGTLIDVITVQQRMIGAHIQRHRDKRQKQTDRGATTETKTQPNANTEPEICPQTSDTDTQSLRNRREPSARVATHTTGSPTSSPSRCSACQIWTLEQCTDRAVWSTPLQRAQRTEAYRPTPGCRRTMRHWVSDTLEPFADTVQRWRMS